MVRMSADLDDVKHDDHSRLLELLQERSNVGPSPLTLIQVQSAVHEPELARPVGVPVITGAFVLQGSNTGLEFVPDAGEISVDDDIDHVCHTEDRYFVYRGSVSNADVTHCLYWASDGTTDVFHVQTDESLDREKSVSQSIMLGGKNLMVGMPSGASCRVLDDMVCPLPTAIVGKLQPGYGVEEMKCAMSRMGRSLLQMHADDWKRLCASESRRVSELKPFEKPTRAKVGYSSSYMTKKPLVLDRRLVARLACHQAPIPVRPQSLVVSDAPVHPYDIHLRGNKRVVRATSQVQRADLQQPGSSSLIVSVVRALADALGFALDFNTVTEFMLKRVALRLAKLSGRVHRLTRQGLDLEAAREQALASDLADDITAVVIEAATECMRLMVLTSAAENRPAIDRLDPRHATLFTMTRISGPVGEASLIAYVAARVSLIDRLDGLSVKLTPSTVARSLTSRASHEFGGSEMARALSAIASIHTPTYAWQPDGPYHMCGPWKRTMFEPCGHLAEQAHESPVPQIVTLPSSAQLRPAAPQAAMGPRQTGSLRALKGSDGLEGIVARVRRAGAKTMARVLAFGADDVLLSLVDSHVPAFLALLVANPLRKVHCLPLSLDTVAFIKRVRHNTDRRALQTLACPIAPDRPYGRSQLAASIGRFVMALYAVAGLDAMMALERTSVSLVRYNSRAQSLVGRETWPDSHSTPEEEVSRYDMAADAWSE
jgi:hypothetical protein